MSTSVKPRVIVIASDAAVQTQLAAGLLAQGYDVDIADNQRSALRLSRSHRPQFIVVDSDMPTLDEWFNDSEGMALPALGAPVVLASAASLGIGDQPFAVMGRGHSRVA